MTAADELPLRRCVLAVAVLHGLDLRPERDGALLDGRVFLAGWELRRALRGADPEGAEGVHRLAGWALLRRALSQAAPGELVGWLRPVGLPVGHAEHPGREWCRERVLGGALDLGLGLALDPGLGPGVVPLSPGVLEAAEVDADPWWPECRDHLEEMGAIAAEGLRRRRGGLLRPVGDCDVVTLLGSAVLRAELARDGMRAVAVPMRTRGWTDPSHIDPAFAGGAAAATANGERGFPRPVLVTAAEVVLAPAGGRPADLALRDPAVVDPWAPQRAR
ncbi:MAG: hypothetical protein ACOYY2_12400 [Actinomycetota bacterium]